MENILKNYYIGIDMGTDSVGWAVTDTDYNLLRARGQDLWGSYLFDEAVTAEERRMHRTARRRYARTRQRISLLQELFAEEICKTDPLFFIRLNNSPLLKEDKDGRLFCSDALFGDKDFNDKEYYKKYPTIYHLRAALTEGEITDIRLLYLAVHHIIKNRGHFLFESQNFDVNDVDMVKIIFSKVNNFLSDRDISVLCTESIDDVLEILKNKKTGKKDKSKKLYELFSAGTDKCLKAAINAMCGCTVNLKDLYCSAEDYGDINSFCFDKSSFDDEDLPKIENAVGGEEAELVRLLKSIYDWSVLVNIMGSCRYISLAKINIYNKHKNDLALLKEYIRANCPEKYNEVFRYKNKTNNYAAYIGTDRKRSCKKCSKEDFYKFLKNTIKVDDPAILADIEAGGFMPKQVSASNGVIPYQVNLDELSAILSNAENYFPFLKQVSGGYTVSQKIKMLMTFRVPYYVGPLNTQSKFSWVIKNKGYENVIITPWNFDKAIDKDSSEDKFIGKMTNKCTYLIGEDVLPASSLLYSEFTFLNELNNMKINGIKDGNANKLIYDYAKNNKKVTLKNIHKMLVREGILPAQSKAEDVFSGTDGDFKTSLAPFVDFAFLGDRLYTNSEMVEEIIFWITVVSDKNRLEKRIKQKYGQILSDGEIKRIKGFNYTKWGRFSKTLLTEIKSPCCTDENGELLSIIDAMKITGENFMQLLSSKYGFDRAIEEYNNDKVSGKVTYKTVQDLYCSPSVKRSIWRTVCLVNEIVKIQGGAPEKVFVETIRKKKDKSRKGEVKNSRKEQLIDLYKSIKDEERDWLEELKNTPDSKFDSDKVVLYYRQMGKCMYTGEHIPLESLFDTNIYDKDHIYPQSKIKDDSLDNLVLVKKDFNEGTKKAIYPIDEDTRHKMGDYWKTLKDKGLISETKYLRLTRNTPLTADECADFINRQLVFTGQSTIAAAQILKQLLPETEIVYSKADNASAFKQENGIIKVRELNDLHHAKDAYINIVVGNVYNTKFNHNAAVYFKNNNIDSYNLNNLYKSDIPGAWKVSDREKIIKTVSKNTCRVVRMTNIYLGALFEENASKKKDGLVPLKSKGVISETTKYGGYNKAKTTYFILVRSLGKDGKKLISLEAYPLYRDLQTNGSVEAKIEYCLQQGMVKPEVLIDYIKLNTLFYIDGSYAYINAKTNNSIVYCNANQLFLKDDYMKLLKTVMKFINERKRLNKRDLLADGICAENNIALFDKLIEKLDSGIYNGLSIKGQVPKLRKKRDAFIALTIEDQCMVINEILKLMQCNRISSDFSLIGSGSQVGVITTNKFIQDNNVKIIMQSPTGYYRKVIDIKEFL